MQKLLPIKTLSSVIKKCYYLDKEKTITKKHQTKLIHIGEYMAEVEAELIDTSEGWSPYLSIEDAQKLDDVCEALCQGNLKTATNLAQIYTVIPIAV